MELSAKDISACVNQYKNKLCKAYDIINNIDMTDLDNLSIQGLCSLFDEVAHRICEVRNEFFSSIGCANEIRELYSLMKSEERYRFRKIKMIDLHEPLNRYNAYIDGMVKFINTEIEYLSTPGSEDAIDKIIAASRSDEDYITSIIPSNEDLERMEEVSNLVHGLDKIEVIFELFEFFDTMCAQVKEYNHELSNATHAADPNNTRAKLIFLLFIKSVTNFMIKAMCVIIEYVSVVADVVTMKKTFIVTNESTSEFDKYKLF